jgi:hypothetical protein
MVARTLSVSHPTNFGKRLRGLTSIAVAAAAVAR